MTKYYDDRVVYHPHRTQRFTVWCQGEVVLFAEQREDAERRLRHEQVRHEQVRHQQLREERQGRRGRG